MDVGAINVSGRRRNDPRRVSRFVGIAAGVESSRLVFVFNHVDGCACCRTLGISTRVTGILTALLVISYANRGIGSLFGLDQITAFLTLYLTIGNSGDAFSIKSWLTKNPDLRPPTPPSVLNNLSIRLMQVHLCVVYLFAGLGKCQGVSWWNGEAIWGALASYEYQTLDMTWMAEHLWLVNLLTLVTLAFEVGYIALIWPRLTRPLMLLLAIPLHLGIGICMGMMTFALIMLIANLAFVPQAWVEERFKRVDPSG